MCAGSRENTSGDPPGPELKNKALIDDCMDYSNYGFFNPKF